MPKNLPFSEKDERGADEFIQTVSIIPVSYVHKTFMTKKGSLFQNLLCRLILHK